MKYINTARKKIYMLNNEEGITLIALIITIIILLILAGVTISMLNNNGLFDKVKQAREKENDAQVAENETLLDYENKINEYIYGKKEEIYNENSKTRYILVEVYDHISGEGVAISELRFYDKEGNKISYNILENEAFDSVSEGLPAYWNLEVWNYSNLYDNAITNTSIQEGGQNCTALLFSASAGSQPNSDNFARFVIDLGEERELENINICLGDSESRIPKSISLYEIVYMCQ